jgi:hypothetical protein
MLLLFFLLIPVLAFGASISADIDRNVNLPLGTRDFGPVNIPDDLSVCTLAFDRSQWTNASAKLKTELSISVDGGPFTFWLGMTSEGGSGLGAETSMTRQLPAGTNRRVQGVYEVTGARFRSTVSVRCD